MGAAHAPGPRLHAGETALEDDRPDGDARVEGASRKRVADRTRVWAAPVALELRDQLHRPHLRRTGHCAGREARAQKVERGELREELAGHLRHEMSDVR